MRIQLGQIHTPSPILWNIISDEWAQLSRLLSENYKNSASEILCCKLKKQGDGILGLT
jgi:hypothetical protein